MVFGIEYPFLVFCCLYIMYCYIKIYHHLKYKKISEEFSLNFYDYGARWLDPGMSNWWEVDPLSKVSWRWSPYAYGNNNLFGLLIRMEMASQTIYGLGGSAHVGGDDYAYSSDNKGQGTTIRVITTHTDIITAFPIK